MKATEPPSRVLSPRRWREYVVALHPGLCLSKSASDLCDRCVRIEIELQSHDITEERKTALEAEKALHLDEAISQRRVWSNFVKDYAGNFDPNLDLPDLALPRLICDDPQTSLERAIESPKENKEDRYGKVVNRRS